MAHDSRLHQSSGSHRFDDAGGEGCDRYADIGEPWRQVRYDLLTGIDTASRAAPSGIDVKSVPTFRSRRVGPRGPAGNTLGDQAEPERFGSGAPSRADPRISPGEPVSSNLRRPQGEIPMQTLVGPCNGTGALGGSRARRLERGHSFPHSTGGSSLVDSWLVRSRCTKDRMACRPLWRDSRSLRDRGGMASPPWQACTELRMMKVA